MLCKADLHVHTLRSPDSRTELEEAVSAAKKAGLDFLAVNDHDISPLEEVFSSPEREGVLLVPGIEYSTDCGHLLGLFLERPCPPGPEKGRISFHEASENIRQSGGLCVIAHPFQSTAQSEEERFETLLSLFDEIDGVEVCNRRAGKKRKNANELAEKLLASLPGDHFATAGSDSHFPEEIGSAFLTIDCEEKSLPALKAALLAKKPVQYTTAPCCHRLIAQTKKVKLQKAGAGPKQWAIWCAFRILCALRDRKRK